MSNYYYLFEMNNLLISLLLVMRLYKDYNLGISDLLYNIGFDWYD